MKEYCFKTNMNRGGCVAEIKPSINANPAIKEWKVNTANPAKVLTVRTKNLGDDGVKVTIADLEKAFSQLEK